MNSEMVKLYLNYEKSVAVGIILSTHSALKLISRMNNPQQVSWENYIYGPERHTLKLFSKMIKFSFSFIAVVEMFKSMNAYIACKYEMNNQYKCFDALYKSGSAYLMQEIDKKLAGNSIAEDYE